MYRNTIKSFNKKRSVGRSAESAKKLRHADLPVMYTPSTSLSAMCAQKAQMVETRYNRVCDPKPVDIDLTVVLAANTDHFCTNSVSLIHSFRKRAFSQEKKRVGRTTTRKHAKLGSRSDSSQGSPLCFVFPN